MTSLKEQCLAALMYLGLSHDDPNVAGWKASHAAKDLPEGYVAVPMLELEAPYDGSEEPTLVMKRVSK
jgi:hypothetical protein